MLSDTTKFLSSFMVQGGLLQLSIGDIGNATYYPQVPQLNGNIPKDRNVYFAPAMRARKGSLKEDVLAARAGWVDNDDPVLPEPTFPASIVVWSGHGWHLYWLFTHPVSDVEELEKINKILLADIPTGDRGCWNANRLLRLPGTWNVKVASAPVQSRIDQFKGHRYDPEDFDVLAGLGERVRHVIRTGESSSFESRSERDWFVINQLIEAGASDSLIEQLFDNADVGDKYRNEKTPEHYLLHTLARAREQHKEEDSVALDNGKTANIGSVNEKKAGGKRPAREKMPVIIQEKDDGYYMVGSAARRVSTFVLHPKVLLEGNVFDQEDALVCDVQAGDVVWPDVTFPKRAFTSVAALDKHLPNMAWQWIGHDTDIRLLLPFLYATVEAQRLPRIAASPTLGLHFIRGVPYFLGDKQTVGPQRTYEGTDAPITWLPTGREHPKLALAGSEVTEKGMETIRRWLPQLNEEGVVWSMVGWYAAACLKPWFESKAYRFPILNITGTKGSGKTTLSQRIMMPLFGQTEVSGYDAASTPFVKLALMGSSNAVPIAFSEFRYDGVEAFIRLVLLAYDTGHAPRGRADQTTQDYPLSAPVSVDGEDVISDAAARERIIVARFQPDTIAEGGDSYAAFNAFRDQLPANFGGHYISRAIQAIMDGTMDTLLGEARREMFDTFPSKLPDRVRNNYTVVLAGAKLFSLVVGMEPPAASVFTASIGEVINLESGRSRTLVDEFIETVVNQVANYGHSSFPYQYEPDNKVMYFQVSTAHSWWLTQRRRQGRGSLERDAIRAQLREATYSRPGKSVQGMWMIGIHLPSAKEFGLDIPEELGGLSFTINF